MQLVRYQNTLPATNYGVLDESGKFINSLPTGFTPFNADESTDVNEIAKLTNTGESIDKDSVKILAPVANVQKVICVGKNYADHAREMASEPPAIPVIFNKFPTTLNHPDGNITLPSISDKVDFEAELVVVMGRKAHGVSADSAMEHVFGFCCGNDVSARDWQKEKPGGQWLLGKSFDGFAPIGPVLVTKDEIDCHNLDIQLRLNGEVMQNSNTRHLIFPVDFLVAHISQFCTLFPGDLIFTGTPAGVGAARTPPVYLKAGDEVAVEIERLGVLTNRFV